MIAHGDSLRSQALEGFSKSVPSQKEKLHTMYILKNVNTKLNRLQNAPNQHEEPFK